MQGKQNTTNMERKGPHKSMHCKFCKPPGAVAIEKPSPPQLETNTNIHLIYEGADLRLSNVHNEPGFPIAESEACMCILEGENPCPKCAPDKTRPPPKKKVCNCPKGAKPHPSMFNVAAPKKKKQMDEDDEFWWEKYSREHDAIAKETWAAYMAQRRKDKKGYKCQSEEQGLVNLKTLNQGTFWCLKLSCQQVKLNKRILEVGTGVAAKKTSPDLKPASNCRSSLEYVEEHCGCIVLFAFQMIYVEFLSTAIRLDSDENITDRTHFVLGGIGLYPRPSRKFIKKCLRYCHYNTVQFLNQLHLLIKDMDPFEEKCLPSEAKKNPSNTYTWNEKLIMSCICYLELPAILRELMDRLPPLPRKKIRPQIPYPVYPELPKKKYECPYEEPIWQDRLNWTKKMKIDRINRARAHMETKRVKIPPLALVRRPSLIDARPPFLAQIEANERASRRIEKEKKKKPVRKHPIPTFNSAVDVTAIAGIEASEISITDKADTDDICVFLREPKESESTEWVETEEESDFALAKEVKFLDMEENQVRKRPCCELEDNAAEEGEAEEIPFKTPPKTESGATIESPCPPPDGTPGPPAFHFESGKRELDIVNEEICSFFPFADSSRQSIKGSTINDVDDVELKLKSAAAKLRRLTDESQDTESKKSRKKKKRNLKKKGKCKKGKSKKKIQKMSLSKTCTDETTDMTEEKEEEEEEEEEEGTEDNYPLFDDDLEDEDIRMTYKKRGKYSSSRDSEISDPDPETDDEWPSRPPCTPDASPFEEQKKPLARRKTKKSGKTLKKKPRKKKISKGKNKGMESQNNTKVSMKKKEPKRTEPKEKSKTENPKALKEKTQETEKEVTDEEKEGEKEKDVFRGKVEPLVKEIIQDLAEEGFCCASYPNMEKHPDVEQLILHLKGIFITKKLKKSLVEIMKYTWTNLKDPKRGRIPELELPKRIVWSGNWHDKKYISKLAKIKLDQFYYKVALSRATSGRQIYTTSYEYCFGTTRYLKLFYAYMVSKYEDAILKGVL